ncbi:hypothetical protein [Sphingomonas sp. PP-CE-1A-559]|jgi:hypothetical protein|uniref:hypothetical protein n=1 Tax=Sphingomonas sp. PP-CE-1A-559 TaxID=2135657 RepID=UPI001FB3BE37|nr:hypothetical protein [Sphingomonas sp. PP-CE-1A-559]
MKFLPSWMLIPAQIAAATFGLAVLTMWPPASGSMLVVPLGQDGGAAMQGALAGGAALLGTGPFPGSLVVVGDRARIAPRVAWNVVIMAAPPAGCGVDGGAGKRA